MNKIILMGNLTRDPEVRYSTGDNPTAIARYTLAVNRRYQREGEPSADFFSCVTFGKSAEFVERYFRKGIKITLSGRIEMRKFTNKEGQPVNTVEVIVEEQEFAESKAAGERSQQAESSSPMPAATGDGFMNIPDGIDEELPFN